MSGPGQLHHLGNRHYINGGAVGGSSFNDMAAGFGVLRDVFLSYQPIANRGTVNAPSDPRTDGSKQIYSAQRWGRHALYINTDSRSYRDLRIKTANGSADDTSSPGAGNANRTYLGATQREWLTQTLLQAQNAGVPWTFIALSDPIDQIGPIGGALPEPGCRADSRRLHRGDPG